MQEAKRMTCICASDRLCRYFSTGTSVRLVVHIHTVTCTQHSCTHTHNRFVPPQSSNFPSSTSVSEDLSSVGGRRSLRLKRPIRDFDTQSVDISFHERRGRKVRRPFTSFANMIKESPLRQARSSLKVFTIVPARPSLVPKPTLTFSSCQNCPFY